MVPGDDDESAGTGSSQGNRFAGMSLGQKQREFARMVAKLIEHAYAQGFELSLGDAYRDPRVFGAIGEIKGYGHAKSAHKLRLAIDLNLFLDGKLCTGTQDHEFLGRFWTEMGGTWGGSFGDGNHYSIEHNGVR